MGLVFRSIGYRGVPLPDVPFNEDWGVISNEKGRILGKDKIHIEGLYATGWIKRGPTGVIGTNKTDSGETVKCIIDDIAANKFNKPQVVEPQSIESLIKERNDKFINYKQWQKVDQSEIERGQQLGRPRLKYTDIEEILRVAKS